MALSDYLSGWSGILFQGQYLYLFILSFNPMIFRLFKPHHYIFLAIGVLLSFINHRAVLSFLLLILLDLDLTLFSEKSKKNMLWFFLFMFSIISIFGGS